MLPAFNEEVALRRLLPAIEEAACDAGIRFRVVVVDDGSDDGTSGVAAEYVRRFPVELLSHARNLGLGAALRDGLLTVLEQADPSDVVVTMDADCTHTPELIPRMRRRLREGYDVVIASRYLTGSRVVGLSTARTVVSIAASWMLRIVFPTRGVRDFTCGYRAYRVSILQELLAEGRSRLFDQEGFSCMVEIVLALRRRRALFTEVPLVLRYDLKPGPSKMRLGPTVAATLSLIARWRFGRT